MRYVVIPKGISNAIFESQVLERFSDSKIKFLSYDKDQKLTSKLNEFSDLVDDDVVYFRSVTDFFRFKISHFLSTKKTITEFDFRGVISEESYLRNGSYSRKIMLRALEFFAYKYADRLFAVSSNLSGFLKNEFYEKSIDIIPCCVPLNICRLKSHAVNFEKLKFIYVGSMSSWQSFETICRLYSSIHSERTEFTVLTRDIEGANKLLAKYDISAKVMSANRDDVLNELDIADFGFIYRKNCLVNTTASPVKFLEYTARGVIPIMSPYVGDYSEIFKEAAYIIDNESDKLCMSKLIKLCENGFVYKALNDLTVNFTWDKFDI